MKAKNNDILLQNKVFGWLAITTAFILSIPLIAMQFSEEVDWKLNDFVIMGILIFATGSIFILAARKWRRSRLLIGTIVAIAFLYIWAELAVGIFTNLGN